jgi:hypothetical protein
MAQSRHIRDDEPPEASSDEDGDRGACEGEQGAGADEADGLEHAHAPETCNACATIQKKCVARDSAHLDPRGDPRGGNLSGRASAARLSI